MLLFFYCLKKKRKRENCIKNVLRAVIMMLFVSAFTRIRRLFKSIILEQKKKIFFFFTQNKVKIYLVFFFPTSVAAFSNERFFLCEHRIGELLSFSCKFQSLLVMIFIAWRRRRRKSRRRCRHCLSMFCLLWCYGV